MAKEEVVQAPALTSEQFNQLLSVLMQNQGGLDKESLRAVLKETASQSSEAMKRALKPENDSHPGISAFSYPEGDVARPRPVLPYELWWNNYPVHKFPETQHVRELELASKLVPGEYTVLRKDLTPMRVKVKGEKNADGVIEKMRVEFPVSRGEKSLVPPMQVMLYQLVHVSDNPKESFGKAMMDHLGVVLA